MRRFIQFALVVLAAFGTACTVPAFTEAQRSAVEGSFNRTLNVSGAVDLDVSTGSGSINVRPGSGGTVEIRGQIRAGTNWFQSDRNAQDLVQELESNPPIEQSGNMIRIGRLPDQDRNSNVSISYEIYVPPQSSVKSHAGSGHVEVSGLNGPVESSTGSGSITLTEVRGHVNASTGSGSIDVKGIAGELTGSTGSGSITVEGEQTGIWELHTGSGSVNIRLPQSAGFDLNAHTGSGQVYVNAPITVQGRIDGRQRDVTGKVRGGGYALDIRTGSGSIRIE
jgi:hypothetical protein